MVEDGENEEGDGEEQRDRVKSRKFKQMMGQGLIPTAAAEAYAKCTNRKEQTALINSPFSMKGGRLQLQEQFKTPKITRESMKPPPATRPAISRMAMVSSSSKRSSISVMTSCNMD